MLFAPACSLFDSERAVQIALFHPGTQHSRQTARALARLERLAWFATSLYPYASAPGRWAKGLTRFGDPDLDPALVRRFGAEEWVERLAARGGLRELAGRINRLGNRRFARRVATLAARQEVMLWGYDSSSAAAFADPRLDGRVKILDRTIGDWRHWNALLPDLRERWGDWVTPADAPVSEARIAIDRQEYAEATHILSPAPFVAATIAEHEDERIRAKIVSLPYAHDDRLFFRHEPPPAIKPDAPVRFLFVGNAGLRKGLPCLLEAFARLPRSHVRLTLAGQIALPPAMAARLPDTVTRLGPVSRQAMPDLMRAHHVLVLPSWFEGSAITLLEARACGLAIIQTRMAGRGADADSGIVLERPETDTLAEAMSAMLEDRTRLSAMREAAWRGSASHDHAAYCRDIAAFLESLD